MEKHIILINLDSIWERIEYKIIDELDDCGCLGKTNPESKKIIGNFLLRAIFKLIKDCDMECEYGINGLITKLSNSNPYVLVFINENNISLNKEILEYIEYDDFVKQLKSIISDINKITGNRILNLPLDFKMKILRENTKNDNELLIKQEIVLTHCQKNKNSLKSIIKLLSNYNVDLPKIDYFKLRCES